MKLFLKISRSTLKGFLYFLEFFLFFLCFYFSFAITGSLFTSGEIYQGEGVNIFVKSNGVHTDLVLPVSNELVDWTEFIPTTDFPQVSQFSYISIGWGDKGFFLDTPEWSDLTINTALSAAFLPSGTAMHVAYHEEIPLPTEDCKSVVVPKDKYLDLRDYIKDSFKLINRKVDLIPNRGYWNNDNFYEAEGSYHLFKTCNTWTNKGLQVAGIKTGIHVLFPDGILRPLGD